MDMAYSVHFSTTAMLDPRISTNLDPVLGTEGCNVTTSSGNKLPTTEYSLDIRQQPVNARSCGSGLKDRRTIDPPPILQLKISDTSLTPEQLQQQLRDGRYVASCFLCDENGTHDVSSTFDEQRSIRQLLGQPTSTHFYGKDEWGKEGCFFSFADLSCRHPGLFKLKFTVIKVDLASVNEVRRHLVLAEVYSDRFTVYEASKFPGMQPSTKLVEELRKQGCWILIKKGNDESKKVRTHAHLNNGD